jgi:hypothetical protein
VDTRTASARFDTLLGRAMTQFVLDLRAILTPTPQPILLTHGRSPGDVVCFTAAIRDLAATYPGRFAIHVGGSCSDLWVNNPHIAGCWGARLPRNLPMFNVSYGPQLSRASDTRLHFVTAFHRAISDHLGIPIPVLHPHGDLHLADEERTTPLISGRYWYFIAGGKADITTKIWPDEYSQRLVSLLAVEGITLVQGGGHLSWALSPGPVGCPQYGRGNGTS